MAAGVKSATRCHPLDARLIRLIITKSVRVRVEDGEAGRGGGGGDGLCRRSTSYFHNARKFFMTFAYALSAAIIGPERAKNVL